MKTRQPHCIFVESETVLCELLKEQKQTTAKLIE